LDEACHARPLLFCCLFSLWVSQTRDKVIHFMPLKVELRQMIGAAPRTEYGSEKKAMVFAHAPPPPIQAHG